jgi:hypothetical protein
MTNLASASAPFYIEEKTYEGPFPVIVLAATDCCFEYLGSPTMFEKMLLDTLAASNTADEWGQAIAKILAKVSSDDCTMALAAVGWASFGMLQASFTGRTAYVAALGYELDRVDKDIHAHQAEIDAHQAEINAHQAQIERLKQDRRQRVESQWKDYRDGYVVVAEGRRSN